MRNQISFDQGWSINDVVIRGGVRMVDVEVYVDGHYVNTYPGDGMIVATPHGSTAYGMAAGGPILTAGVRGFALVPISCHSPIRTPLIVDEEAKIEMVIADDDEATLILDGRPTETLGNGDLIVVERGDHRFRLVSLESTSFFEAVRTKFNFQIRPDAVPTRRLTRGPERMITISCVLATFVRGTHSGGRGIRLRCLVPSRRSGRHRAGQQCPYKPKTSN